MNNSVCGQSAASSGSIVVEDEVGGSAPAPFPGPTRWSSPGMERGALVYGGKEASASSPAADASRTRRMLKMTACQEGTQVSL